MKLERVLVWIIIIIFSVISLSFAIGYFFIETVPTTLVAACIAMDDTPPKPKQSYGEFPFLLTYEINGQRKEIKDTLVIEYLGLVYNKSVEGIYGKENKWKAYMRNSEEYYELPYISETLCLYDGVIEDVGYVQIHYDIGRIEYYMGLEKADAYSRKPGSIVAYSYAEREYIVITEEELYNIYNIRIIEKSISPPLS